ncbi:MAG: SCO family protein, partial [Aeromonas sp.]
MMKLRYPLLFLLLAGGLVLGFYAMLPAPPEHADYYSAGRDINDFAFTDADNQPFTPANLLGHWTFLFVGYTFCPDICPTTLA